MNIKDRIATYYTNARELVKQGNAKAARAYVLEILNEALKTYHAATSILLKAKTEIFMQKWIGVSRDLYDKGVTDYVKECFGLNAVSKPVAPQPKQPKAPATQKVEPKQDPPKVEPRVDNAGDEMNGGINIAGLIDEAAQTQGWCAEVFEKNQYAIVEISVSSSLGGASGTGFIISNNGYLLTNDHVVYDEENYAYYPKITMNVRGDKKRHKLEVVFSDRKADVALCRFDTNEVTSFTCVKRIADYALIKQGADCLVVGNAFGMGLAPFTGIIRFTKNDDGDLVYTAPSNPGDSGGPVFNRSGECIGINKSRTVAVNKKAAEAYANATPMDTIEKLLSKWTSKNNIIL